MGQAQEMVQALPAMRTGAEILLACLAREGVELIFGYPGGAVLPLYDALYDGAIPNILTRHEQGAVHAAEGYAKATGKTGVVIVTSGPGATNAVTGIADAYSDSVPLVVFTGQVASPLIGTDGFQEADVLGITMPITKHNYQVRHVEDLPAVVAEAFRLAGSGRKGPVVVDLPKDITTALSEWQPVRKAQLSLHRPVGEETWFMQLERLAQCLQKASRPLLLVGGGAVAAEASTEVRTLTTRYGLPVVSTLLGLGCVSHDDSLFLGMGGMHGSYAANMALAECDLLINVGSRFDDRLATVPTKFAPHATIVHIDIDAAEIGKIIPVDIPLVGDAKRVLQCFLDLEDKVGDYQAWQELCQTRKATKPFTYDRSCRTEIKPQRVIEHIGVLTKGEAIVVTDVGQHQMWAAQYYPFTYPKQFITSGGLGTMGYGIPAALGAKLARPEAPVVLFVGDGGFQMTNQEMALMADLNIDVKFVLLNNASLGMVRQWQEVFFRERRSASVFHRQPDFMKLSEAYGVPAMRITNPETVEDELEKAFAIPGPMLIEVVVSPTEHVLPMVAPGKANHEMMGV